MMSCRVFYPLVLQVTVLAIPQPEPDDVHIHLHGLDKVLSAAGEGARGMESEPEPEPEPACSPATRCKVGRQGDRACGPNSRCDRKQRVCVCNSPAQDYPNCCWPSCRGIDAVCINGGPCQCIGYGHYPNCQEVCGLGCGDGEICKKVGNKAMCVCKSNFYRRKSRDSQGPGVCIPCDYFGHDYRDYGDYPLPPAPGWE